MLCCLSLNEGHPDRTMTRAFFSDDAVQLDLLRERAFNLRWAQQPADVIPLTAADPDFPVCPAIQERLVRYVRDGVLSYAPPEGLPQFREAVAEWLTKTRRIVCASDAARSVPIRNGATTSSKLPMRRARSSAYRFCLRLLSSLRFRRVTSGCPIL